MSFAAVAERETDVLELHDARGSRLAFRSGIKPDPHETIDEFSDAHVWLPSHAAEPGQWRTERTPFLREIMQCLSPRHPCREVIFIKCTQIGGTQISANWLGYTIARSPSAFLFCEPTKDLAKKLSEDKVDPMLTDSPILRGLVQDVRARDSKNRILSKRFRGGFVNFIGTNSAVGLRYASAPRIVMDEVDAYPFDVDDEGHPCKILEKRAAAFFFYKLFKLSTPGVAGSSYIEPAYEAGSRGRYHVPCPFCFHLQPLQWANLIFTFDGVKDPARASYQCAGCRQLIPERYKPWMFADRGREGVLARWVHEDPENPVRSFHLNLLYQPYGWGYPWARLVRDFLDATEKAKSGDVRDLKTFTNTVLAETWEEQGEKADADVLYQRREVYEAPCPAGVLVLTAAVDLQDNRIEASIEGWGVGEENWAIEKRVFPGSPAQPAVWADLTDWLHRKRLHAYGVPLRVEAVGVDTGGHHTKEAYWYVRRYRGRCYALKGSNDHGAPLVPPRPTKPKGAMVHLYHVGTVAAKDTLFARLALTALGPGYVHYPVKDEYDQECFKQLTAEEKRKKYDRGVETGHYYKKVRSRNEELDLKVMHMAVVQLLNPNWERLAGKIVPPPQVELAVDEETGEAVEPVGVAAEPAPAEKVTPVDPLPKPTFVKKHVQPRRGGFVGGWR